MAWFGVVCGVGGVSGVVWVCCVGVCWLWWCFRAGLAVWAVLVMCWWSVLRGVCSVGDVCWCGVLLLLVCLVSVCSVGVVCW